MSTDGIHTHTFHSVQDHEIVRDLNIRDLKRFALIMYHVLSFLFLFFAGIGQKFATLEEKSIISAVIRNYKIEAVDRREDLTLLGELILRPKNGLRVNITPRHVD